MIPVLKIRRSRDRLIFNMGIPILVRRHQFILRRSSGPLAILFVSAKRLCHFHVLFCALGTCHWSIRLYTHFPHLIILIQNPIRWSQSYQSSHLVHVNICAALLAATLHRHKNAVVDNLAPGNRAYFTVYELIIQIFQKYVLFSCDKRWSHQVTMMHTQRGSWHVQNCGVIRSLEYI